MFCVKVKDTLIVISLAEWKSQEQLLNLAHVDLDNLRLLAQYGSATIVQTALLILNNAGVGSRDEHSLNIA